MSNTVTITMPSSNGRTAPFGGANRGSSPCGITNKLTKQDFNNLMMFDKVMEDSLRQARDIEVNHFDTEWWK